MKKVGEPAIKPDRRYTYADYRTWPDDERWELIDGIAWNMSPAPGRRHQGMAVEITRQIATFLEGKSCRVYSAPFDVLLPESREEPEDEVTTVVQPDLSVICDRSKLTEKGCFGAPDLVVEILSPHTSRKDMNEKLSLYERHGVREYWIVDPGNKYVHVYVLSQSGAYPKTPALYLADATLATGVLPGLSINLPKVFAADE